ncbi:MAG TPA: ABC transporter permease [Anaerolineales bacterium]|nr:ABC transporter permease [Anaerolineales bacterium]
MKPLDLLALIFENLGRRKARVAMTAIGVIIGTAAVVVLVSLGVGLQQTAQSQLFGIGDLSQIIVYPKYEFVGGGGGGGPVIVSSSSGNQNQPKQLTNKALKDLAGIPGVALVIPRDYIYGDARMLFGRLESYGSYIGLGLDDLEQIGLKAQGGTLRLSRGTAIVGTYVAQNFYDPKLRPGQPSPEPPDLLDKNIKIVIRKFSQDGSESTKTYTVRVVGIIAETRNEPDYAVYLPLNDVLAINSWLGGKRVDRNREGYSQVVVKVADVGEALRVTDDITALGFDAFAPQSIVQSLNQFFIILQVVFGGVGAIALLVAAIGIANTMTMAILERTREIGLMKAVGATNRDVLTVFLGEAGGIGFIGGVGGVIFGWVAGQVINTLGVAYMASQAAQSGAPPTEFTVAATPLWLPIFALVFATVIGLLSGLYPALRAATLVPVQALKYE